MDDLV